MANSAELIVFNAIRGLVNDRCYPDVAPAVVTRPYITYMAVGGQSVNYMNNTVALQNARVQVDVWADDRLTAVTLMNSVINALTPAPINATNIGAPVSSYEQDTKLYGSRLDFSIWFTP